MPSKNDIASAARQLTRQRKNLDPDLWTGTDEPRLLPRVSKNLKKIAGDFWDKLEHGPAKLVDVIITGSSAGYKWNPRSDLDLHLVVDLSELDSLDGIVESYCRTRTKLWNREHDVEISGHPLEIYIQDADEKHVAASVYSVMNDEWIAGPGGLDEPPDLGIVVHKAAIIAQDIERLIAALKDRPTEARLKAAERLRNKLREERQAGLDEAGEMSERNLAFKVVRRIGLLDELDEVQRAAYDQLVSVE